MQKNISTKVTPGNSKSKTVLCIRFVCAFWVIAKFISWKVWVKERHFPTAPVADLFNWPPLMQYVLFVCSLVFILFLMYKPLNKIILITLLVIEILSCLADQNRWQPWEYQYLFTILICIINFKEYQKLLSCIAFIMAATYLYSGIGKLNEGYLVLVWDNIFLKKIFKLNELSYQQNIIHYLGYATALAEIIFAIGLYFPKTKKAAAYGMIFMHLLILYAIGPLGVNYNIIIWPWNVLMILLLYVLFIHSSTIQIQFNWIWNGWNKLILICWGIMPALNYLGLWDSYLSSRLYSGSLPLMSICLKDSAEIDELKPYLSKTDNYKICNGNVMAYLQTWAMKEMNVPPYPEMRVYKKVEKQWRENHTNTNASFVYFYISKQKQVQFIETK